MEVFTDDEGNGSFRMKELNKIIQDYKKLNKELEEDIKEFMPDDYGYNHILDKMDLIDCFIKDLKQLKEVK